MPTRNGSGRSREATFLLWAVRETGAMDALAERAGTPEALAADTALTPDAAETVVRCLADLGFLERVRGQYELTNRGLGFLAKRDLRSIGTLPAELDALDALVALPETLESGSVDGTLRDEDRLRNRLGAAAATDEAVVRARVTAAVRAVPDAAAALVVGDGAGVHARELAARGLETTLLDDPAVIDAVAPLLAPTPVETTAASLSAVASTDLLFGVDLVSEMAPAEARTTVATAADRVADDGAVVLVEPVRGRVSPDVAVDIDVRRLAAGDGRCYPEKNFRDWFDTAGLSPTFDPIPGTERVAVVGRPERAVLAS